MAVRGNYPNIVSLLLKHSPNVNAVDQDGMTALAVACKEGNSDIAFQLIAAGAYVNVQVQRSVIAGFRTENRTRVFSKNILRAPNFLFVNFLCFEYNITTSL